MVVQHNISALNAHRQLRSTGNMASKNLEKLSSGLSINRAADDASGLAVSEKMRTAIGGLGKAIDNANQGVNLIQTAEGGMQEIHNLLQRLSELAVQSSNGTYHNEVDREGLDLEFQTLLGELDRISEYTNYNGIKLLDGSKAKGAGGASGLAAAFSAMQSHLSEDKVGLLVYDAESYGFTADQTVDTNHSYTGISGYNWLRDTLKDVMLPNVVNSMVEQFECFDYLKGASIGIGLRLYNDPGASESASVYCQWWTDSSGKTTLSFMLSVNVGKYFFDSSGTGFANAQSRKEFESLIAHEMMHAFMFEATSQGMLAPGNPAEKFPLWFSEGMAQTAGGDLDWTTSFNPDSPALNGSSSDADIKQVMSNLGRDDANIHVYKTGYFAMMYLGYMAAGGGPVTADNILKGVNKLMYDIIGGKSLNQAIIDNTQFSSVTDFENQVKGGTAQGMCDFVRTLAGITSGGGRGSLLTGDLSAPDIVSDGSPGSVDLFKLYPNDILIKNDYPADVVIFSGGSLYQSGTAPVAGYGPKNRQGGDQIGGILLQLGAEGRQNMLVFINGCSSRQLGLTGSGVGTQDDAAEAIEDVKKAVDYISMSRAQLGAYQNRLEHTIGNLQVTRENLIQSESTIRDTDMAREMMEFTKNSILLQSAQAMLAQANQLPQGILQLLS